MVARLKQHYGQAIREASSYLGQNYLIVDRSEGLNLLQELRDREQFDYLVDVTALHYPQREQQFEVVWILYSFPRNERIRVKALISENENAPSVTTLWSAANWLEREVFDMWKGHPLRKDYGIIQQDQEWVQANLGIESGQ